MFIDRFVLIALFLSGVYYFCLFSYLVKFLGTLTRVVKLDHSTLGLLQTTTRYRAVPDNFVKNGKRWH